jgi:hypothetical protein
MLLLPPQSQIYVYTQSVDMRKSANGLIILLVDIFDQNPQTGV